MNRDGSLDILAGRKKPLPQLKKYKMEDQDYNLFKLEGQEEHYQGVHKQKASFSVLAPSKRTHT